MKWHENNALKKPGMLGPIQSGKSLPLFATGVLWPALGRPRSHLRHPLTLAGNLGCAREQIRNCDALFATMPFPTGEG